MAGSANELRIFYYGVTATISAAQDPIAQEAIKRLNEDFQWFTARSLLEFDLPAIELILEGSDRPAWAKWRLLKVFKTRSCKVYGFGPKRICDYGNGLLAIAENTSDRRTIRVFADSADELYEVAYNAFLSAIGEELDARGYHRVHALGLEYGGFAFLVTLPSGGGKSAMAALLKDTPGVRVLSDEMPLAHEDWICPFPLRIALKSEVAKALSLPAARRVFKRRLFPEKGLHPIPASHIGEESLCQAIFLGEVTDGAPGIEKVSRFKVLRELWKSMVVGIGLAQMAEHMLRLQTLPRLIAIAFSRLITAFKLALVSETYVFRVSRDARKNALVLSKFLQKYPTKELELLKQKRA